MDPRAKGAIISISQLAYDSNSNQRRHPKNGFLRQDDTPISIDAYFQEIITENKALLPKHVEDRLLSGEERDYYTAVKCTHYWQHNQEISIESEIKALTDVLAAQKTPTVDAVSVKKAIMRFATFYKWLEWVNSSLARELKEALGGIIAPHFFFDDKAASAITVNEHESTAWKEFADAFNTRISHTKRKHPNQLFTEKYSSDLSEEMLILAKQRLNVARTAYCTSEDDYVLRNPDGVEPYELAEEKDTYVIRNWFQQNLSWCIGVREGRKYLGYLTGASDFELYIYGENDSHVGSIPPEKLKEGFHYNPKADKNLAILWPTMNWDPSNILLVGSSFVKSELKYALIEALEGTRLRDFLKTLDTVSLSGELRWSIGYLEQTIENSKSSNGKVDVEALKTTYLPLLKAEAKRQSNSSYRKVELIELTNRLTIAVKNSNDVENLLRAVTVTKEITKYSWGKAIASCVQDFFGNRIYEAGVVFRSQYLIDMGRDIQEKAQYKWDQCKYRSENAKLSRAALGFFNKNKQEKPLQQASVNSTTAKDEIESSQGLTSLTVSGHRTACH